MGTLMIYVYISAKSEMLIRLPIYKNL